MNAFFTGQIIEEARKKANMTQAELAEKIGTNKSYISRVETGKTEPKVSTFYRIASALGLNVGDPCYVMVKIENEIKVL